MGKRGRGVKGKVSAAGLLKREGKVYTKIVKSCSKAELMPIIRGKVFEASELSDGWKISDSLVLNKYKYYRVFYSRNEFARGKNHLNGIESFWSYAKWQMVRSNGIPKEKFILYLKKI